MEKEKESLYYSDISEQKDNSLPKSVKNLPFKSKDRLHKASELKEEGAKTGDIDCRCPGCVKPKGYRCNNCPPCLNKRLHKSCVMRKCEILNSRAALKEPMSKPNTELDLNPASNTLEYSPNFTSTTNYMSDETINNAPTPALTYSPTTNALANKTTTLGPSMSGCRRCSFVTRAQTERYREMVVRRHFKKFHMKNRKPHITT